MRIAWFRATPPDTADPLDDTAALIDALRSTHRVDVIVEHDAHDFVWREALHPSDLCVYELGSTAACAFEWGYLLNYPGVVLLRSTDARDTSTAPGLGGHLDQYMSAFQIDRLAAGVASLRVPLLASRSVVVQSAELGRSLQARYPGARVRYAPIGIRAIAPSAREPRDGRPLVVGSPAKRTLGLLRRAVERVRAAGLAVELRADGTAEDIVATSDVIVVVAWPPQEVPLAVVVAGMAAGTPVVTLEMEATAEWPALDPQTWQVRGPIASGARPVAVTVEPLDDEHSVVRALTRLARDERLCDQLGRSAHAWWLDNATPAHAAAAWRSILEEASTLSPPPRPTDWPRHLDADGMELSRTILEEHGVDTDI